jgi:hypothetical protein
LKYITFQFKNDVASLHTKIYLDERRLKSSRADI